MIIFYNKKNGQIFGTIEGRVHSDDVLKNASIKPSKIKKVNIKKYVVPYERDLIEKEVPITELRVTDTKTGKVEKVVIGKKKEMVSQGLKPTGPLKDFIIGFEKGEKKIYDYKVKLDKNGKLTKLIKNDRGIT